MLKQWCSIRKRSLFIPTPEEADVTNKVCDVILSNPDHFPPHTFEAGISHHLKGLIVNGEAWTREQAFEMNAILGNLKLGSLALLELETDPQVLALFAGIEPI